MMPPTTAAPIKGFSHHEVSWGMSLSRPLPRQELGVRGVAATEGSIKLTDFVKLKTIGTGSFGKVLLVEHKRTMKHYALKVLEKAKVVAMKQCYHVVYEKEILMSINCAFVVRMYQTFKDNCNLFMLMEYVQGGEMFHHLRNVGHFSESHSKFYAAQVVLAFEYLHSLNIIYRDLKPENVMIDHTGYIKLIDFGFAKRIRSHTWTMCGTPDYMAPEIILSKGYGQGVDWWALGILIYEMVSGYPPFYADKPTTTYDKIVRGQIRYPDHFTPDIKHLLCNLLQLSVDKRLGLLKNGVLDVKQHSWFATIDWDALAQKRVYPPFVPRVRHREDISNFDVYDEESLPVSAIERYPREFSNF